MWAEPLLLTCVLGSGRLPSLSDCLGSRLLCVSWWLPNFLFQRIIGITQTHNCHANHEDGCRSRAEGGIADNLSKGSLCCSNMFQFPIVPENGFNQVVQQLAVFASPCCVAIGSSSPSCSIFDWASTAGSTRPARLPVEYEDWDSGVVLYQVAWVASPFCLQCDMIDKPRWHAQCFAGIQDTAVYSVQHDSAWVCSSSSPFFCWTLWLWQVPHLWFRISWRQLKFCRMGRLGSEHMSTILRDTRYNHAGLKIWILHDLSMYG